MPDLVWNMEPLIVVPPYDGKSVQALESEDYGFEPQFS